MKTTEVLPKVKLTKPATLRLGRKGDVVALANHVRRVLPLFKSKFDMNEFTYDGKQYQVWLVADTAVVQ